MSDYLFQTLGSARYARRTSSENIRDFTFPQSHGLPQCHTQGRAHPVTTGGRGRPRGEIKWLMATTNRVSASAAGRKRLLRRIL